MRTRYRDFLTVCMFAGAPIAAAGIAWPAEIIAIVFGSEFLPGTRSLVLLMATALLTYATFPVAAALLTWHDQKTQMLLMAAGGLVNIGLNLVLIPRYGMDGAAAATLVSQAFLLIALLLRLRVRFGLWELGPAAGIAAIAGLVFALVVALSRMLAGWVPGPPWLSLFLYAVIGGLVYCGVVAALGLVEPGRLLRLARGARGENPL